MLKLQWLSLRSLCACRAEKMNVPFVTLALLAPGTYRSNKRHTPTAQHRRWWPAIACQSNGKDLFSLSLQICDKVNVRTTHS